MKPVLGIDRDTNPLDLAPNKYIGGNNFVITDNFTKTISQQGNKILKELTGICCGLISTSDSVVVFSIPVVNTINYSEIGIYRNETYTTILRTKYLNFDINYPIYGEYHYNLEKELIVFFNDYNDTPKAVNLDNLPFDLDSNYELIDSTKIDLLEHFLPFKPPIYNLVGVFDNSGNLPLGIYYITIQYKASDGGYSNFADISNPIMVVDSSKSEKWENYNGNIDGTITGKSIGLTLSNVDNKFKQFRVGIIFKNSTNTSAYVTDDYTIQTNNYITINSIDSLTTISLDSILVKSSIFEKIGSYTSIQNRLYTANNVTYTPLKYQKYANNIKVEWVYENQVSLDSINGSYKDALVIFDKKGFMPGEIYALYIRLVNNNSNKSSQWFHIAGRDAKSGELNLSTNSEVLSINSQMKKYQVEETAGIDGISGEHYMGYWENENELYPSSALDINGDFDGTKDYNLNSITNGRNLQNTNVKHHKFPALNYLSQVYSIYSASPSGTYSASISLIPNGANFTDQYHTAANASFTLSQDPEGVGTFNDGNRWINNSGSTQNVTINFDIHTLIAASNGSQSSLEISMEIFTVDASGNYITPTDSSLYNHKSGTNISSLSADLVNSVVLSIPNGQGFGVKMYGICNSGYAILAGFTGSVTASYGNVQSGSGSLYGRVLGLKLSNIQIPNSIKSEYSHIEIGYAKRDVDNMTVLGNSLLPDTFDQSSSNNTPGVNIDNVYTRFYSFDLLYSKTAINPSHITYDYLYYNTSYYTGNWNMNQYVDNIFTSAMTVEHSMINLPTESNIRALNGARYILNAAEYTDPSNTNGEEYIYLEYKNGSLKNVTNSTYSQSSTVPRQYLLGTLYSFKSNVYRPFSQQNIVRTGKLISINDNYSNGFVNINSLLGGDVHLNLHGISLFRSLYMPSINNWINGTIPAENYIEYYLMPEYSISNIGLRYVDNNVSHIFFPMINLISNTKYKGTYFGGDVNTFDLSGTDYIGNSVGSFYDSIFTNIVKIVNEYSNKHYRVYSLPEFYGYNKFYNAVNDIQAQLIYDYSKIYSTNTPYRINRSIAQGTETDVINWRTFLANDYVDCVSNRKEIVNLDTNGQDLLVELRYGTFVYTFTSTFNINNNQAANLGDADIFNRQPEELIPDEGGYVGCQSKFASIWTKFGNIIVDRSQGKVFIYYNNRVDEISRYGFRNFFENNLQYSNTTIVDYVLAYSGGSNVLFSDGALIDVGSTSLETNMLIDDPFGGLGIYTVWDEKYQRLILYKQSVDGDNFAIDYYPAIKSWGFFHDFMPTYAINNRNGIFAVTKNEFSQLNVGMYGAYETNPTTKVSYPSFIDIAFNTRSAIAKEFKSFLWNTEVIDGTTYTLNTNKTFDKAYIYNNRQYSGLIDLVVSSFGTGNIRNSGGYWKFNEFRDILIDKTTFQLIDENNKDLLRFTANGNDGITFAKNWYDKLRMIDSYMIIRLIFTNDITSGDKIIINEILSNFDKQFR